MRVKSPRSWLLGLILAAFPALASAAPPQNMKQGTIPALQAVKAQHPSIAQKVQQAIDRIQESLLDEAVDSDCEPEEGDDPQIERSLFLTPEILDPKRGQRVFDREKQAAEKLLDLISKNSTPAAAKPALQAAVDALVQADQGLAQKAINDATALLGSQAPGNSALQQAQARFNEALAFAQQGKADKAIEKFGKSWEKASGLAFPQAALKFVRDLEHLLCHVEKRLDKIEHGTGNQQNRIKKLAKFISKRAGKIQSQFDQRVQNLAQQLGIPMDQAFAQAKAAVRLIGGAALETRLQADLARLQALAPQVQDPQILILLTTAIQDLRRLSAVADGTPPLITNLQPPDMGFASPTSVISASYSDALSGVDPAQVKLLFDGQDVTAQATVSATGIAFDPSGDISEAVHQVLLTIKDFGGNQAQAQASWTVDVTDPTIAVVDPVDGSTVMTATPTMLVTYSDSLSGIDLDSLVIMLDGMDVTSRFTKTGTEATYTPQVQDALSNDQHSLTARILDRAGNEQAAQSHFSVQTAQPDATPPSVSIAFPRNTFFGNPTAFEGTTWRVVADARDPGPSASGIQKVEFFSDGVKFGEDTMAPYETTISFPENSAGQNHVLTAVATDNATNHTTSQGITVHLVVRPATGAISFRASGGPTTIQAGSPFPGPITIEAIDAQGSVDPAYEGFIFFFTSDPRSSLNNFVFTEFTSADQGVIHVDFGNLLSGQPPLLTAGQQVIAMADFSSPARDQGVISVQVQAGPPALINLTQQVAEPHGGQDFPVLVGVSDAFGNSLSGIQVQLKVFENQILTQTLSGTTTSPVAFNIHVGENTDNFRLEAETPSIPLPPATYERLVDVQTSVSIVPYLSTVGQDVTLTITVLNRNGLPLQQIPTGIYGDGLEPDSIGGMPTSFGGFSHAFSLNIDGSFSVVGQFVRPGHHQPFVSLDHGPVTHASPGAFVQPGPPVSLTFPNTDNFGLGLGFFNMSDQFGNWTPYEVFRVDLVSAAGTQTFYGYTNPSIGSWLIMTPSSWAFRGLSVTATITSLSSGAYVTGVINVNPLQPFITTSVQVLGPEPFGQAGSPISLPGVRVQFAFPLNQIPIEIHQSARFTSWEVNPQILSSPSVTDLSGNPLPHTVSGNMVTIQAPGNGTGGFILSGVTISTQPFPDSGMTGTIYLRASDFLNSPVLAHLGTPGVRMVQMTNVAAFEERASTTEQARVIAMSDGSIPLSDGSGANGAGEPFFMAMAAGDPQVLGSQFMATLESLRPEGGPVEGGDLPSQTQVELLRVSDVWYVSRPIRALAAGQPLTAGGLTGSDPSNFQTVAAEPGGSLFLSTPGLGSTTSRVAGLGGTMQVTLGAGEDPVPGETGPRPLDFSVFRDTTPTIRLTPSVPGFSVSQTALGTFLLTSQENGLQAVLNINSVVEETTNRTFTRQSDGNDLLLEVGGPSNLAPLAVGALTFRLSGNLQFKAGPTGTVLETVVFRQRVRALVYGRDNPAFLDEQKTADGQVLETTFGDIANAGVDRAVPPENRPDDLSFPAVFARSRAVVVCGQGLVQEESDASVSDFLMRFRLRPVGLMRDIQRFVCETVDFDDPIEQLRKTNEIFDDLIGAHAEPDWAIDSQGAASETFLPRKIIEPPNFIENFQGLHDGKISSGGVVQGHQHFRMRTYAAHGLADEILREIGLPLGTTKIAVVDTGLGNNQLTFPNLPTLRLPSPINIDDLKENAGVLGAIHDLSHVVDKVPAAGSAPPGHGTQVAVAAGGDGISGLNAAGDNGVLGVGKHASLRIIRARTKPSERWGSSDATCINALTGNQGNQNQLIRDLDIRVVNVSTSTGGGVNKDLEDAVMAASKARIIVVMAAGQSKPGKPALDVNLKKISPAHLAPQTRDRVNSPETALLVTVSAVEKFKSPDASLGRWSQSNFGNAVSVAAPGEELWLTMPDGSSEFSSGTSLSTPYVAGLLAEMRIVANEAYVYRLKPETLIELMEATAENPDGSEPTQRTQDFGNGVVNAWKALLAAANGGVAKGTANPDGTLTVSGRTFRNLQVNADGPFLAVNVGPGSPALITGTRWYGFEVRVPAALQNSTFWIDPDGDGLLPASQVVSGVVIPNTQTNGYVPLHVSPLHAAPQDPLLPAGTVAAFAGVGKAGVMPPVPFGLVSLGQANKAGEFLGAFSMRRSDLLGPDTQFDQPHHVGKLMVCRPGASPVTAPPAYQLDLNLPSLRVDDPTSTVSCDDFVFSSRVPDLGLSVEIVAGVSTLVVRAKRLNDAPLAGADVQLEGAISATGQSNQEGRFDVPLSGAHGEVRVSVTYGNRRERVTGSTVLP